MSSLTRLIENTINTVLPYPAGTVGDIGEAARSQFARCCREFIPEHDAEIREQAKREQMEADCKVVCWACSEKDAPVAIGGSEWVHEDKSIESDDVEGDTCEASPIRAAWAKAHPEVEHE